MRITILGVNFCDFQNNVEAEYLTWNAEILRDKIVSNMLLDGANPKCVVRIVFTQ